MLILVCPKASGIRIRQTRRSLALTRQDEDDAEGQMFQTRSSSAFNGVNQ